jgi:hypothetical protein
MIPTGQADKLPMNFTLLFWCDRSMGGKVAELNTPCSLLFCRELGAKLIFTLWTHEKIVVYGI